MIIKSQGIRRKDIQTEDILSMLKADYKVKEIAAIFNCGEQLIRFSARAGGYIFARGNRTPKKPKAAANGRKMCACCGLHPVPEKPVLRTHGGEGVKLTRLCYDCWKNGEDRSEIDY